MRWQPPQGVVYARADGCMAGGRVAVCGRVQGEGWVLSAAVHKDLHARVVEGCMRAGCHAKSRAAVAHFCRRQLPRARREAQRGKQAGEGVCDGGDGRQGLTSTITVCVVPSLLQAGVRFIRGVLVYTLGWTSWRCGSGRGGVAGGWGWARDLHRARSLPPQMWPALWLKMVYFRKLRI